MLRTAYLFRENMTLPIVYLIEPDEVVRNSISELLNSFVNQTLAFEDVEAFTNPANGFTDCGCIVCNRSPEGMGYNKFVSMLHAKNIHLPIIFVSGCWNQSDLNEAIASGAFGVFFKPFEPKEFMRVVQEAIDYSESMSKQE